MTDELTFRFMNHKGEISYKRVKPLRIEFLYNPPSIHQPGWFLTGIDLDRNVQRSYALTHVIFDVQGENHVFIKFPEVL